MVRHDDPEYVRRFGAAERSRAFGLVAAAAADGLTDLPYRLFAARALVGIP